MRAFLAALLLWVATIPAIAESGLASIYGSEEAGGCVAMRRPDGDCERLDLGELTAAHKTLPLGVRVLVTNLRNGRKIAVRINDRGPYKPGRIIDLTPRAAHDLGFDDGLIPVEIEIAPDRDARCEGADCNVGVF